MYIVTDYKKGELGILDTSDNKVEYFNPKYVKEYFIKRGVVISGITLAEDVNPMFTVDGLEINISYPHVKYGKWTIAVLKDGTHYGRSLSSVISGKSVAHIYDNSKASISNPLGFLWASYYLEDILNAKGNLILDMGNNIMIDADSLSALQKKLIGRW